MADARGVFRRQPVSSPRADAGRPLDDAADSVASFLSTAWAAFRRLCGARLCQLVLAAGLVNLLGGLIFGLADAVPTTRVVIDVVYANFAMAAWVLAIVASGEVPGRHGWQLAAKAIAVVALTLVAFGFAGAVGVAYQLLRSDVEIEWVVHAHGLFFNLGWNACHLAALAGFFHGLIARRWIAATATIAVYAVSNLAFDHDLLRFGGPISVWSDIGGYGAQLAPHLALGIYWTGLCAALLAGLHLKRGGLTPKAIAWGWAGLVLSLVTGAWTLARPAPIEIAIPSPNAPPQPVYSRLDVEVEIRPTEGWLRSNGAAILVNHHDVPIPDLHFAVPPHLAVASMSLTGDLLAGNPAPGFRSYRLNRPLEPRETLKVTFDLIRRQDVGFDRIIANGTVLATADVLPSLGFVEPATFFENAPPTAFRVRLGTSLDQIAIAPGVLKREWKENGTRYFEYETTAPIRPRMTLHSAPFMVVRLEDNPVPVEIYYHPPHDFALADMVALARARLQALPDGAFRHEQLRIVEVGDWWRTVQPPGVLGLDWHRDIPNPGDQPFVAGVLSYSERAAPFAIATRRVSTD